MQSENLENIVSQVGEILSPGERRKDRSAVFLELTRSICPVCKKNLDAQIYIAENRIFMEKTCNVHGRFKALLLSDAQWYLNSVKFNKPGSIPLQFNSKARDGCPTDCGICPNHQQHTCLGILEVTQRCNLSCPQCFAASAKNGADLTLAEATQRVDNLARCEGRIEVLQISGGEPTIHPQLMDIIQMAKSRDVQSVMVNTNGIRLAHDPDLVARMAEIQPSKPSIYLQFDGFDDAFYEEFRGKALLDTKLKAIEDLSEYGFKIALVVTLIQGKNDDQIGKICEFAIKHKHIRAVNFQPVFYEGRIASEFDPMNRLTLTDVFREAEEQTDDLLRKSDFIPVPCPFPSCSGLTYVYHENGETTPITRLIDVEDYLDFIKNRTMLHLSEDVFGALKSLFSFSVEGGSLAMVESFCTACGITLPRIDTIAERITMIGAMSFMDRYTFDWKRAMKCCIHELAAKDRIIPFCVYNNLYRKGT